MTLRKALENWDGKSKDQIEGIYNRYVDQSTFVSDLLVCSRIAPLQNGATWLLKRYIERSEFPDTATSETILALIPVLEHWESRLHLLQVLPYLPIPNKFEADVEAFAKNSIEDENKFVRAWGYNALYELACQYPAHQNEATQFLEMALRDEPASVRARVRQALAKGF